jgi:hypothetical protein
MVGVGDILSQRILGLRRTEWLISMITMDPDADVLENQVNSSQSRRYP